MYVSMYVCVYVCMHVCIFQHNRLDLRGRRDAFSTFIDVRGSLATRWVKLIQSDALTQLHFFVAGVALSAPQARSAWQA